MSFSKFELTQWVSPRGARAIHNFASSASPALSIKDLIEISSDPQTTASNLDFQNIKLNYDPDMTGQAIIKSSIAALFDSPVKNTDILTATGASLANQIVLQALLRRGDHVICVQPTYSQLQAIPQALGAEMSFWHHRRSNDWNLDIKELEGLIRENTRMIIVNSPNNPTGSLINDELQRQIISFAKKHDLIILADEIFRPLFHTQPTSMNNDNNDDNNNSQIPQSFLDHAYNLGNTKVIVTGSMSKSRSFPGIRLGWIICRDAELLWTCNNLRFYSLLSVSQIDELIAAEALSVRCREEINKRNLKTASETLKVLDRFVLESQSNSAKYAVEWCRPVASATTLIRFINKKTGRPVDDIKLSQAAIDQAGILLVPASLCFNMRETQTDTDHDHDHDNNDDANGTKSQPSGWMRIGFVVDATRMTQSLDALSKFVESYEELSS